MGHKKRRGGFTLAELLIVVAIIGILVAVAIPVFSSTLDKTKEATCLANRTMLYRELIYDGMLNGKPQTGDDVKNFLQDYSEEIIKEKGYICPSGEYITASYSRSTGEYSVYCQKHGDKKAVINFAGKINELLGADGALRKTIIQLLKDNGMNQMPRVDSNAPDGGRFTKGIKECLEKATDYTLGVEMTKTWSISPVMNQNGELSKYQVYWSDVDISECKIGDQILAMRYNSNYQGKESYIACWIKVEENTFGDKTYNVVSQKDGDFKNVNEQAGKTFDEAYKEFESAKAANGGSGIKNKAE